MQYDLDKQQKVSAVEVYWWDERRIKAHCRIPQSWRLLKRTRASVFFIIKVVQPLGSDVLFLPGSSGVAHRRRLAWPPRDDEPDSGRSPALPEPTGIALPTQRGAGCPISAAVATTTTARLEGRL